MIRYYFVKYIVSKSMEMKIAKVYLWHFFKLCVCSAARKKLLNYHNEISHDMFTTLIYIAL